MNQAYITNSLWSLALAACLCISSGCYSTKGHPDRSGDVAARIQKLESLYFLPTIDVLEVYKGQASGDKKAYRDQVVSGRMLTTDLQYSVFTEAVYREGVTSNLTLDILGVLVGGAGAITTGGDASQILSAVSGGISGSRTAINKELFYEQTMPALLSLMSSERERIRSQILKGLALDHNAYPLAYALGDLDKFYTAGTIPGAIAKMTEVAGKEKSDATKEVIAIRDKEFIEARAQESVSKILEMIDSIKPGKTQDILTNPPSSLDPFTSAMIQGRLGGKTLTNALSVGGPLHSATASGDDNAKGILKQIVVIINDRSEGNLNKWKAAIVAAQS